MATKLNSGYAFEYRGKGWQSAKDDAWDTIVYTPTGKERRVGMRTVDDSRVVVFQAGAKRYIAQTSASLGLGGTFAGLLGEPGQPERRKGDWYTTIVDDRDRPVLVPDKRFDRLGVGQIAIGLRGVTYIAAVIEGSLIATRLNCTGYIVIEKAR